MSDPADPRLVSLLGGAELAGLRQRLRRRLERGTPATLRLDRLDDVESAAMAGLLGRKAGLSASLSFSIAEVDAVLRSASIAPTLRAALEALDGPIIDQAAQRSARHAEWAALCDACTNPYLSGWLVEARGLAVLKRLAGKPDDAGNMLDAAQAVLKRLPAAGMPRSHLAAEVLGDAHGLDEGRAVATLVVGALRWMRDNRDEADGAAGAQDDRLRSVWADAGVLVNELARPALFLNLPAVGSRWCPPPPGEPGYASLRLLLRDPPRWTVAGQDVFVCENPNLVAIAADALGAAATMVCTDGMPGAAQRTLLLQLAQAGARLHYHGDFDWPGIAIGNLMMRSFPVRPWRFGVDDYHAALDRLPTVGRTLGTGRIDALWDVTLGAAMHGVDRAIDEEAVADTLLADMADANQMATKRR